MNDNKVFVSSKIVEISEYKTYLELVNRVCFYDEPNFNGTMLPYDEAAEEKAQTLKNMPVVAKYTTDALGKPTFKGHEVSVDKNGDVVFGTIPIGVHTDVYVQEDEVEITDGTKKTLPCLFAKQRVWSRNKNAVAAIQRLFAENNLHNSWEISVMKYEYENGVKKLLDYVFEGNAFIGVAPAYGNSAQVLSVASRECELLVAEALSQDLIENNSTGNEVQKMEENSNETVEPVAEEVITEIVDDTPVIEEVAEAKETIEVVDEKTPVEEVAALTDGDIRNMLYRALVDTFGDWPASVMVFPEEHEVWARKWESKETEMLRFTYIVENNVVVLSEGEPVSLIVTPRNINSTFDEQSSALIAANNKVNQLTAEIASLSIYKEAAEKAEREAAEARRKSEIAELRQYIEDAGVLSKEEIESDEIAALINDLKTLEVKALIADRIVGKKNEKSHETSEKKQQKPRMILTDCVPIDSYSVLKEFVHR